MRTGLFVLIFLSLWLGESRALQAKTLFCRWGPKAALAPIPGCGVPRKVEVRIPDGAWKLYFAVNENPGLSGYNHRAKGTAGSLRPFKRKINLLGSDLFLCPADFKKERVLAFQLVSRKRVLVDRPTCRLGTPSESPRPAQSGAGAGQVGGAQQAGAEKGNGDNGKVRSSTPKGDEPRSISRPLIRKGGRPVEWRKIDRTARALAITALIFSLLALVGVSLGVRYFRKRCEAVATKIDQGDGGSGDAAS